MRSPRAIVAHDADVDVLLSHSSVDPKAAKGLVQSAVFTRGPKQLSNTAVWVGGSRVSDGEEVFDEIQKAFFGPFQVSVMLDSNGCNTTAATSVALLAKELDLEIAEPKDDDELAEAVDGASIVLAAGPAGVELLPKAIWTKLGEAEVLVDFNAAEPLGIEGSDAQDSFEQREGKKVLGALAVGGPKMKVHKACVRKLFESNDVILDAEGVYTIAKELV